MIKKVLILTSTNLSCNPRCLKEIRLLVSKNIHVTLVAFRLHNWTDEIEESLKAELNEVEYYYLETTKKHFIPWLFASFLERIAFLFAPLFPNNIFTQSIAVSKRSWMLLAWSKKWDGYTDLVIAHNPAAFYPAYYLFKKKRIPFALDIEDYHPGEGKNINKQSSVSLLMKSLIPKSIYTSYASPYIKIYSEKLFLPNAKYVGIVVNNIFSNDEFLAPIINEQWNKKIKFVWFSQIIDYGRGLEQVLSVFDNFQNSITLTLIGNLRNVFFEKEIKHRIYVEHISPLSQIDLHKKLNQFDVGLAIENIEEDLNRSLCLTNKIWAYFQAGLYILATDTIAQIEFMNAYPTHGALSKLEYNSFNEAVSNILDNGDEIIRGKESRFDIASKNGWESESNKLLAKWSNISK